MKIKHKEYDTESNLYKSLDTPDQNRQKQTCEKRINKDKKTD